MVLHKGEVFVTKYAMSMTGVFKLVGEEIEGHKPGTIYFKSMGWFLLPGQYAITASEAEAQVAKKLKAKIRSLEKQLAKANAIDPAKLIQEAKVKP